MYLEFYGLEKEPFRLSPDPRFLHLAIPHRSVLQAMLQGVDYRKGLQVCVGPIGTGKTTLLYCLQCVLQHESSLDRPVRTAFIVNPVLTGLELFEALLDDLEVTFPGTKPASLHALHEILAESSSRNGKVILIIDEAHLLSPELIEEVRLLLNLDHFPTNVLQIILCGQPELLDLLAYPAFAALKQRVSVFSQLRPLSLTETKVYIGERLRLAGLTLESPFSDGALEEIHRRSNGVPRVINVLCDRALVAGFRTRVRLLGADFVTTAANELAAFDRPANFRESAVVTLGAAPAYRPFSDGNCGTPTCHPASSQRQS